VFLVRWYRAWRKRRQCFHHDPRTERSWIRPGQIIDYRKLYRCRQCGRTWII
jgi:hypothetical protein